MANGYLSKSATNTAGLSKEAMLYCKTNIGGYFFDGFIQTDVTTQLELTSNPVETGVAVTDHSYVKPVEMEMQIKMSDVMQSLIPGQFTGGWSRSVTGYKLLREIQNKRIPVSVLSKFGLFENMLIKTIKATDTSDTWNALDATVSLVELPVARVRTVKISKASQTTINTEMGKIQAVEATSQENESLWYNGQGFYGSILNPK